MMAAYDERPKKKLKKQTVIMPSPRHSRSLILAVCLFAFVTRFYAISTPSQVVFDEVHFGKFMSYYIKRTFYFDVHPPLGRLIFGLAGWLSGFNGDFLFENIGDDYVANRVPYVFLRSVPATFSTISCVLVYECMRLLGFADFACFLSASMVIFDNALAAHSRLLMLDSSLILFMLMALYSYVRFLKSSQVIKLEEQLKNSEWWMWLLCTGFSLSLVMGVKMVGLFTILSIGVAVVFDLWNMLDVNVTPNLKLFINHFAARAFGLIAFPFLCYLSYFAIHFAVLTHSGPGDSFMSPEFQSTLIGNKMAGESLVITFGSNVTIKHTQTNVYLHSHVDKYPLKYSDGRISSQGQQVTGYHHSDLNNLWRILPASPELWNDTIALSFNSTGKPRVLRSGDICILQHVMTDTHLLTHDVASPLMPTNQEFTTVANEVKLNRLNETLFRIEFSDDTFGDMRTLQRDFRLIHVPTGVALFSHPNILPTWGFSQQEVNGNKKQIESANNWRFEDVFYPNAHSKLVPKAKKGKIANISFLGKVLHLHRVMFAQNAAMTKPHPFSSTPLSWPVVQRGISYWQEGKEKTSGRQIYLLPNFVGYVFSLTSLFIFFAAVFIHLVAYRRKKSIFGNSLGLAGFNKIKYNVGFLVTCYLMHYVPFFTMSRALFLHHYLPASVFAYMMCGAMFDRLVFYFQNTQIPDTLDFQTSTKSSRMIWAITVLVIAMVVYVYVKYIPLTYGSVSLTTAEWKKLKIFSSWDFAFSQ